MANVLKVSFMEIDSHSLLGEISVVLELYKELFRLPLASNT